MSRSLRIIAVVLVLASILLLIGWQLSVRSLARDAAAFARAEHAYSQTAFLPGSSSNDERALLNRALSTALSNTVTPAARLAAAQTSDQLLHDIETEIDDIAHARDSAASARAALAAHRYSLAAVRYHSALGEVDALAAKQSSIIEDIRGLSYGANYHTGQIFQHIRSDQGVLTPAYVTLLNSEIPRMEEEFNKRSNLYVELESVDSQLSHALDALPGV